MKILELHLRAYGPFTDRRLDLSGGGEGLHLVFGPNEAGKSSALRALRALLYGIAERTRDDFRHDKRDLRIGGRLRGAGGGELVCYRRKGRKDTLLGADERPIAEERLTRLLGGVDERLFERLFGIDHVALASGGQALLEERGREAEALFGSGLGSTAVHTLLAQLDREAQALFAPRAMKPTINAELSRLAETERRLRDASLKASQWDEARRTVNRLREQLAELDLRLAEASRRRGALERVRRILPGLAKRARILEGLAVLGEVPQLPGDFGQRRAETLAKRRLALEGRLTASRRLTDLSAEAAALRVSEALLAEADTLDRLREQLGSHRKAARDRPGLVARRAALEDQARRRLAEVRPDLALADVASLRPLLGRRRRAAELSGRREALESAVKVARGGQAEAGERLAAKRAALAGLPETPPLDSLQRAVEAASRAGDLDGAIAEAEVGLRRHADACTRERAALGLWQGDLSGLLTAPLPAEETLRRFAEGLQALEEEGRGLEQALAEAAAERLRTEESLRALRLAGAVPSEADLDQAREHRDAGWRLLRRQWVDGEDLAAQAHAYAGGQALPDAFEGAIAGADALADRLRREAQRVHDQAAAQARLEACEQRVAAAAAGLDRLAGARADLQGSWQALWTPCQLAPLPPREMAAWLTRALRLREKAGQGVELGDQLQAQRKARAAHAHSLRAALAVLGGPASDRAQVRAAEQTPEQVASEALAAILNQAEARLRTLEDRARARAALVEDATDLEETLRRHGLGLATAEGELAAWRSAWAGLMGELGLPVAASPGEVSDYLDAIADTAKLIDEAAGLRQRIGGIDTDARQFETDAAALLKRLAPDLLEQPVEEAVLQLHARAGSQREAKSRLDELRTQMRRAEGEVREAEIAIRGADAVLSELCGQAACADPEQLEAVERRYDEYRRLAAALEQVQGELIEGGDGLGIEALEAEAGAVDRDAVRSELAAADALIDDDLRPERERLLERKVSAERDFATMTGGDVASTLAEEAEQTRAGLRLLAERYLRVRLAGRVLREAIEGYRRRHRDPILTRMSGYFRTLTCGSFAAVDTDFDESDQAVWVGVRPTGERLRVEAMSTGTRDQLYLALRLATLDHYLEGSEPLPFIVDDILVQFDDDRALATLGALADFSARSQVILFTHHRQVVEQAAKLEGADGRVFVHTLD